MINSIAKILLLFVAANLSTPIGLASVMVIASLPFLLLALLKTIALPAQPALRATIALLDPLFCVDKKHLDLLMLHLLLLFVLRRLPLLLLPLRRIMDLPGLPALLVVVVLQSKSKHSQFSPVSPAKGVWLGLLRNKTKHIYRYLHECRPQFLADEDTQLGAVA